MSDQAQDWEVIEPAIRRAMEEDTNELADLSTDERRSQQLRGRLNMAQEILSMAYPEKPVSKPDPGVTGVDKGAGY